MQVERFQAKTMKEALDQVKRALGEDAVVLSTRTTRARGKGLLGERVIEVCALQSPDAPRHAPVESASTLLASRELASATQTLEGFEQSIASLRHEVLSLKSHLRGSADPLRQELRKTVEELRSTVARLGESSGGNLGSLRQQLEESGVGSMLAASVIEEARCLLGDERPGGAEGRATLLAAVEQVIVSKLLLAPELPARGQSPRVVALVGPTGVGKTTTVAKLASQAALIEGRRVALLTMDTYRVGGVEQLRRYATLIGVPLEVVVDGASLRSALATLERADLVLVDTSGRSPRQQGAIEMLASTLRQAGEPVQVHLLLPAAARLRELGSTIERYKSLSPDRLLITKVDEAQSGGSVLEACVRSRLPLSFICTGQRVPEDIAPADPAWLAAFILGQEEN
jgi:flagellar biosynthesis protein FlhF